MRVTIAERDPSSTWMSLVRSARAPVPRPWMGSHAARMSTMSSQPERPPRAVVWWEGLEVWQQLAISFPVFSVLTFRLNAAPFNQPIVRSGSYRLFEGGNLAGL